MAIWLGVTKDEGIIQHCVTSHHFCWMYASLLLGRVYMQSKMGVLKLMRENGVPIRACRFFSIFFFFFSPTWRLFGYKRGHAPPKWGTELVGSIVGWGGLGEVLGRLGRWENS